MVNNFQINILLKINTHNIKARVLARSQVINNCETYYKYLSSLIKRENDKEPTINNNI